jgi:prepilin-type N-terminal cleavage/methylation domain-containing protein
MNRRIYHGFSLIEVMIATILIGLAISALLVASSSSTTINSAGTDLSTAEFLVEQIREFTTLLSVVDPDPSLRVWGPESDETNISMYNDVDDFNNLTFNPPVDAGLNTLNDFSAYSQIIDVVNINPSNFTQTMGPLGSDFIRITVTIQKNGRDICSVSWIRANY